MFQGHGQGGRAEQPAARCADGDDGSVALRDPATQAATSGSREPGRPHGGGQERKRRHTGVPAPVSQPQMELLDQELSQGKESVWQDRGSRFVQTSVYRYPHTAEPKIITLGACLYTACLRLR